MVVKMWIVYWRHLKICTDVGKLVLKMVNECKRLGAIYWRGKNMLLTEFTLNMYGPVVQERRKKIVMLVGNEWKRSVCFT